MNFYTYGKVKSNKLLSIFRGEQFFFCKALLRLAVILDTFLVLIAEHIGDSVKNVIKRWLDLGMDKSPKEWRNL